MRTAMSRPPRSRCGPPVSQRAHPQNFSRRSGSPTRTDERPKINVSSVGKGVCRGFPDQQKLSIAILAAKDNKFEPSPPPALIDAITDELLVVASDAVAAAATEAQTKPSGKAKYRLLAWLVADARGAVRAATADAVELAESARAAARSAAASDVTLQATLQATLAGIDADQQAAVGRPRSEVYVGFHELDALLPGTQCEPVGLSESGKKGLKNDVL